MAINLGKNDPFIFVECKKVDNKLNDKNLRQLYEYCRDTPAVQVGILTNGLVYDFYSKEAIQTNYHNPFFTFNIQEYDSFDLEILALFYRSNIEMKKIKEYSEEVYFLDKFEDALYSVLSDNDELTKLVFKEMGGKRSSDRVLSQIKESIVRILQAGIPVMGHLGLTPQSIYKFGTYTVRAKEESEAKQLIEDAKMLEEIGCFGIVLEKINFLAMPNLNLKNGVA